MRYESRDVAGYYDVNTKSFLARGQGGAAGAIHRAVWGPGVTSRADAFDYVHGRLAELAREAARILDLGCGTGASLERLRRDTRAELFGVTNSRVHRDLSRERLGGAAEIVQLDFASDSLPPEIDLAYGIESFVQSKDASAFFENVSACLRPGGSLALVDDFLEGDADDPSVLAFQRGWRASSLVTADEADAFAEKAGLSSAGDEDWTSYLELDRPRDVLLDLYLRLAGPLTPDSERWRSLKGGNALRRCLKRGSIRYRFRRWRKL